MAPSPDITLYFLGASRAIRIAWLLEELDLPYKLVSSPRAQSGLAPPEFKEKLGTKLGKSPTIRDGDLVIQESAAITEYLCETYDTAHRLLPIDPRSRAKVREWIAAAEGTFMIHSLAILYTRWQMPDAGKNDAILGEMEQKLAINVQKDLDWLDDELAGGNGKFLVGNHVTAADTMVAFSVRFILERQLGTGGKKWDRVEAWLHGLEANESYRRAVEKTGFSL